MDSSALELEELVTRVLQPQKVGIDYVCPVCNNKYRSDLAGIEPVCTGPHAYDEHEMTPMVRAR